MRLTVRLTVIAVLVSTLQAITGHSSASAATSYLSASTYYAYESITASGSWSRPYGVSTIEYVVVAGGGRGGGSQNPGHYAGGGGGGGGVRYGSLTVAQSTYTITVGAGQSTGCSQGRGGNSSLAGSDISTISATGGGSGSCNVNTGDGGGGIDANSGGSGGGAGAQVYAKTFGSGNAGAYSPVEGFAGGTAVLDTANGANQSGGGGGGASQVGSNGTTGCGGKGGNGYQSSITGTVITYGGGGGGGTRASACGGVAGTGGGGTGGVNGGQGTAGTNGLGGGGGGTSLSNGNRGGDGVVIIRYVLSAPDTPSLPAISDTGLSNTDDITSLSSFSLTGIAVGGSTVQIYDNGVAVGSACTANMSTGAYSCALTGLTAGAHLFTSKASFSGGAEIVSSGSLAVTIDATAPIISPGVSISIPENQSSISVVTCSESCTLVLIAGVDSASVTFNLSTGLLAFLSAPDYEAPSDVGSDRTYALSIQATDIAGNTVTRNFVVTITNANESSSLGGPALSGTPYKGVSINLTVSANVAGKVRFLVNGKRIAGCLAISTSGTYPNFSAVCPWKPATTGRNQVRATLTPSDSSFAASSSITTTLFIQKRLTTRS